MAPSQLLQVTHGAFTRSRHHFESVNGLVKPGGKNPQTISTPQEPLGKFSAFLIRIFGSVSGDSHRLSQAARELPG